MLLGGGSSCQSCGCAVVVCFDGETFGTGSTQANSSAYLGGGFVTGSGGLTLTKITIQQDGGLGEPLTSGIGGGYTNAPRLRIVNDNAGVPNSSSVVATMTLPTDWSGDAWSWTHSGLSLSANTTYWVELSCPSGTQSCRWKWDGYPFSETTADCYYLRSLSTNSGSSWGPGEDTIRFLFEVNA